MSAPGSPVTVGAGRLEGWLARFGERHGDLRAEMRPDGVTLTAADGAIAVCSVPFPPLSGDGDALDVLIRHVRRERNVGVLLVRLGGFAAGVFHGAALGASRCGSRPVHGRNKKGGSSQARYARRRENQARVAFDAAAAAAEAVLLPAAAGLDAVITGGDRTAVATVLAVPPLAPLRALVVPPHLDVPDPRRRVLERAPELFGAVRIEVTEPPSA